MLQICVQRKALKALRQAKKQCVLEHLNHYRVEEGPAREKLEVDDSWTAWPLLHPCIMDRACEHPVRPSRCFLLPDCYGAIPAGLFSQFSARYFPLAAVHCPCLRVLLPAFLSPSPFLSSLFLTFPPHPSTPPTQVDEQHQRICTSASRPSSAVLAQRCVAELEGAIHRVLRLSGMVPPSNTLTELESPLSDADLWSLLDSDSGSSSGSDSDSDSGTAHQEEV